MLTAILALTTAILVGVCFQHPLATPAGIAVAVWLGVVVRALVRRLRVPDQLRGAYAQAGPAGIFASLLDRFESRPVLAVISFAIVSGGAALELGLRVDERTRATNLGFVGLFVSATALGGAIVGAYQLRRARRKR
jgi:RsiW-degrading membrane proteinase PrsW (M82 family)